MLNRGCFTHDRLNVAMLPGDNRSKEAVVDNKDNTWIRGRGTGGKGEEEFTETEGAGKVGAADP